MTSVQLLELASVRTHADVIQTLHKGLDELTKADVLTKDGPQWLAGSAVVAKEYLHSEGNGVEYKALRFGSWLCLALTLQIPKEPVREVLMDALKNNPIE